MKLIIAEKPSLGRSIMAALGEKFDKHEEYYSSDNYYVVPLHGHILELKDFEEYPENDGRSMWSVKNLPFFPGEYEYNITRGSKKTYDCIRRLLKSPEVTEVIHCGDADREGQIIVDLVLERIGNTKPVSRPFIKSTTRAGLREALDQRRPNEEYRNINAEGKTREYVDFDFGKNLSRFASKRAGAKSGLNVGRVIGAIVTEIYNRDTEIENFVPRDYFKVESDGEIRLVSGREFEKDREEEAGEYARRLNQALAIVTDVQKARQTKRAPRLYSQTDLQGAANKRYGFAPKRTLKAAQSLYEKGLITYPRTNTNYMAEGDRPMIAGILKKLGPDFEMKPVFDDGKVDGHSAITPTGAHPEVTGDEQKIYMMILNRFRAVFCKEPCTVLKTTMIIQCREPGLGLEHGPGTGFEPGSEGEPGPGSELRLVPGPESGAGRGGDGLIEEFKVSGEVPLTRGWKKYEPVPDKAPVLPDKQVGDPVDHDFRPVATQTRPPAHYTVTTLGKWMQNPFRRSEEDEVDYARMLSGMEIGTEATRAAIIDKAIAKEYIDLTKNTYTIRPNGRFLVETCRTLGIDMSSVKTAEMGRDTKAVARGEKTCQEVLEAVRREIADIIGRAPAGPIDAPQPTDHICPRCGRPLKGTMKKLECDCGFSLWKLVAGKWIDDDAVADLLKGKKTKLIRGFKSKAGKSFSAYLVMDPEGEVKFEFPPKPEKVELGRCPKCGKPVYENKKGFGCSGWKPDGKGCDFVIWKYDRRTKKRVSAAQARKILENQAGDGADML